MEYLRYDVGDTYDYGGHCGYGYAEFLEIKKGHVAETSKDETEPETKAEAPKADAKDEAEGDDGDATDGDDKDKEDDDSDK